MRQITYRQAITEALREEMHRDEKVLLMGEDIGQHGGAFAVTKGLWEEFGEERVLNTPISEAAIGGVATGAALAGIRPVAEFMYIDFMASAMDEIVNQTAKLRYMFGGKAQVPVVFRTQGGAGRGNAAQHSQSLEAWFVHVPGLIVVMPSTPHDAKGLLKSAIRDDNPIVFIEHKLLYSTEGPVPEAEYTVPLGKGDIKRSGKDVTVVATSRMVLFALQAAERLAEEMIEVEVVDPRTVKPLDMALIAESVRKTSRVVVVNEGHRTGGLASEITARVQEECFDYLDAPILRVAAEDVPIPYNETLELECIPSSEDVYRACKTLMGHVI